MSPAPYDRRIIMRHAHERFRRLQGRERFADSLRYAWRVAQDIRAHENLRRAA